LICFRFYISVTPHSTCSLLSFSNVSAQNFHYHCIQYSMFGITHS
jgi:hypothetical protein